MNMKLQESFFSFFLRRSPRASGRWRVKALPSPGRLLRLMRPLWIRAICSTMDRPSPHHLSAAAGGVGLIEALPYLLLLLRRYALALVPDGELHFTLVPAER